MRLHTCIHLFVGEIDAVMDKRLTHLVQSSIVHVFRFESRFVNHAVAPVTFPDARLFNKLHGSHLPLRVLAHGLNFISICIPCLLADFATTPPRYPPPLHTPPTLTLHRTYT